MLCCLKHRYALIAFVVITANSLSDLHDLYRTFINACSQYAALVICNFDTNGAQYLTANINTLGRQLCIVIAKRRCILL